jgi:hypothetical protein
MRLTVEELDFEHFPSKNGFRGIPETYRSWVWSSAVTGREDLNRANLGERADRDSSSK